MVVKGQYRSVDVSARRQGSLLSLLCKSFLQGDSQKWETDPEWIQRTEESPSESWQFKQRVLTERYPLRFV